MAGNISAIYLSRGRASLIRRWNDGMPFVVKSTGRTGNVCWLTRPRADGIRTIGPRAMADTFTAELDARIAIALMPEVFTVAGTVFSVEVDD
jgi:hypothetical protein